jgi:16S rRNA (cytidine1402-2'-O)-methyltransferase
VVVVHAFAIAESTLQVPAFDATLRTLLTAGLPLKQAVAITCELSGAPRNAVYERALIVKSDGSASRNE